MVFRHTLTVDSQERPELVPVWADDPHVRNDEFALEFGSLAIVLHRRQVARIAVEYLRNIGLTPPDRLVRDAE